LTGDFLLPLDLEPFFLSLVVLELDDESLEDEPFPFALLVAAPFFSEPPLSDPPLSEPEESLLVLDDDSSRALRALVDSRLSVL
jgi:hypothetical protein